jgi:hypothetical protein
VQVEVRDELTGHESGGGEGRRYEKGAELSQLAEGIGRLAYPGLDLAPVKRGTAWAEPARPRVVKRRLVPPGGGRPSERRRVRSEAPG